MTDCYLSGRAVEVGERDRCEGGFMGRSHVASAVALFLFACAFLPEFTEKFLGTSDPWLIIMAAVATAGASLLPDLDNTSSTARNSLGPVGHIFSELIRAASVFVQTMIRTKRDDPEPNPHRGAVHTIPAALLFGGGALALTKLGGEVTLPMVGAVSYGDLSAVFILFVMLHLALSGLMKPLMKKVGKSSPLGEAASFVLSLSIAAVLFIQAPHDQGFWWLGAAIFAGCVIHILGDCFTTAGAPILFPLSRFLKGKYWWTTRFLSIKAGGTVENVVFVPFFTIVIIVSLLKLAGLF